MATFKNYDSLGHLLLEGYLLEGRMHGANNGYYPEGTVRHRYQFRDGRKTGTNFRYYPNGQVETKEAYSLSGMDMKEENFSEEGIRLSERNFRNNKPHGKWTSWQADGKTPSVIEEYENGKLHGLRTTFHPNGKKATEETWQFNLITGEVRNYYESGELEWKCLFRGSRMHGTYIAYHPNKTVKETGEYIANRKHGEWKEFDESGNLLRTTLFMAGLPVQDPK